MSNNFHLKFNDPAPDLALLDGRGKSIQLSSLWKKKVLILAFTRHFGCPQCKEMVDQLIDAHQTLTERGLRLAIVSHASAESAKAFCDQRAPDAICLADPNRTAYRAYGLYRGEWLKWWANEVDHVSGIVWIALFVKLPAIETIDEQAQGAFQRIGATGKATRLTSEACQIMTQFRIVTFNRIRLCFAF